VADFGMSRILKNQENELTVLPGTVKWMAPEILSKSSTYTDKADVYRYTFIFQNQISIVVLVMFNGADLFDS